MLARQLASQRLVVSSSSWLSAAEAAWLVLDAIGQGMSASIYRIIATVHEFAAPLKRTVNKETDCSSNFTGIQY